MFVRHIGGHRHSVITYCRLALPFSTPRGILTIEMSLRNLDFGFFPYELMMSSVAFLVFVMYLNLCLFLLFSMFITLSK